jgi:Mg2+ and Co2+ transporter CorA
MLELLNDSEQSIDFQRCYDTITTLIQNINALTKEVSAEFDHIVLLPNNERVNDKNVKLNILEDISRNRVFSG